MSNGMLVNDQVKSFENHFLILELTPLKEFYCPTASCKLTEVVDHVPVSMTEPLSVIPYMKYG